MNARQRRVARRKRERLGLVTFSEAAARETIRAWIYRGGAHPSAPPPKPVARPHKKGMLTLMAILLAASALGGCAATLTHPIEWAPVTPEQVTELGPLTEVEGQGPVAVLAGDVVPWDGWLLPGRSWPRVVEENDRLLDSLEALQDARELDRSYATQWSQGQGDALSRCREGHWRTLAAGIGIGMSMCAVGGAYAGSQ